jgi:hypothetical protein
MKPVRQHAPMWGSADCLTACLASIFELSTDAVPVRDAEGWLIEAQGWIRARWDLLFETFAASQPGEPLSRQRWRPGGYSILIIATDGPGFGSASHAVVALDGIIVHNPDPRMELDDPVVAWWGLFLPGRAAFERFLSRAQHEEARQ